MKVIGAGFGRTGTYSIKVALEELGFGPCYHMIDVVQNPSHAAIWRAAARGKKVDFRTFLGRYEATVDWPACSFYKELMEAYPDAKVLLSVRDPDKWLNSLLKIEDGLSVFYPLRRIRLLAWFIGTMPTIGPSVTLMLDLIWERTFDRRLSDRAHAIDVYHRHIEEVKRYVPADRLLVYDAKEGWGPLCAFLGVPVPEGIPMPHLNDKEEIGTNLMIMRRVAQIWMGFGVVVVVGLVVALFFVVRASTRGH
ncbi:MAG: sulfotransferase family protein [Polyangiaceae bacterium]